MLTHLYEFDGHPLHSVAKGAVDLGKLQDEAEKKQAEEAAEAFKPVLEKLKASLKDRAKDVRVTTRLVDSPACIVVEEGDMSGHLARGQCDDRLLNEGERLWMWRWACPAGAARRLKSIVPAGSTTTPDVGPTRAYTKAPWQCLYFFPEPQGQGSLRPTRPHDAGFFGSRWPLGGPPSATTGPDRVSREDFSFGSRCTDGKASAASAAARPSQELTRSTAG